MILNISGRTDIVAFYSDWLMNRLKEGFVDVRNPFNPKMVSRIMMDDVDLLFFCTKNPIPILDQIEKIMAYKFDWPQISFKERLSQEKVKMHNKVGNIVIENEEDFGDGSKLWVFLPEILNDERKELIKTFINENREDIRELSTYNKEADDFIEINIEDFLHTKVKCFTITGQKDDSNEEID